MTIYVTPQQAEQITIDSLNATYPDVEIGDYTYRPADVLKQTDPVAFILEMQDTMNSLGFTIAPPSGYTTLIIK